MYRAYIRTSDQQVSRKTSTTSQKTALQAFSELVNDTSMDGQKLVAVLTYNNSQLAFHRFDRTTGYADYWRDKLDEIELPQAGKPATLDGGKRVNVYLDDITRSAAIDAGGGNVSAGLRVMAALYRSRN